MAKRGIYFVKDNQLFVKTVEISWDKDSMEVNKEFCSEEIFKQALPFMQPCIDVSHASKLRMTKRLSIYNVVDDSGRSIKETWGLLDKSKDVEFLPPGSYDLLYLSSITEEQYYSILGAGSFYDSYFNKETKRSSPAIACAALQLLRWQNKLDYLYDMNKFLYWYYVNCRIPLEYNSVRDEEVN